MVSWGLRVVECQCKYEAGQPGSIFEEEAYVEAGERSRACYSKANEGSYWEQISHGTSLKVRGLCVKNESGAKDSWRKIPRVSLPWT